MELYDETIDFGAHYNLSALQVVGSYTIEPTHTTVKLTVIGATQDEVRTCLKQLADVGVCALRIFDLAFKPILEPAGVSARITQL